MFKYGLKLWSSNTNYLSTAKTLFQKQLFDFLELYVLPNSFTDFIGYWQEFKIPIIIHAPHWKNGLNLARSEAWLNNQVLIKEAQAFADALNSTIIIVHPGIQGKVKETVKQLIRINDHRLLVENKPYYSIFDGQVCVGNSPEEISFIMQAAGVRFCLDVGHAIASANAQAVDRDEYLREFLKLAPSLFHLTDGEVLGQLDRHDHIGQGSYDFRHIFSLFPRSAKITIETEKNFADQLTDFEEDIRRLKSIEESSYL